MKVGRTPSQTVGPFFGFALPWPAAAWAVPAGTAGAIRIEGQILDGQGQPVPEALVETWQLGPGDLRGFTRCATDERGGYRIVTLKPGPQAAGDGAIYAPHLAVSLFGRGLLKRLATRIYFADEARANAADPLLSAIAAPAVRATLLAVPVDGGYRFDIRLQGDRETVFLDV